MLFDLLCVWFPYFPVSSSLGALSSLVSYVDVRMAKSLFISFENLGGRAGGGEASLIR